MKSLLFSLLNALRRNRADLGKEKKKQIVSLFASGNVLLHRGAYMTAEELAARKRRARAYRLSA